MATNCRTRGRKVAVAALAALAAAGGLMLSVSSPVGADVNEVSGSAFAISANALGLINIPPTPAGVAGSATEATNSYDTGPVSVLGPSVPGLLTLGVLEAETQGGDVTGENHLGFAESFAETADIVVGNLLLPALQAQVIRSECRSDGDGSTGLTELVGATAGGSPLVQLPAANTNITIGDPAAPIATAILNEQTEVNVPGSATSIVVTAVHLTVLPSVLTGGAALEVIISRVSCAAQGPDVLISTTAPPTTAPPTTPPPTTGPPTTPPPTVPPTTPPPTVTPTTPTTGSPGTTTTLGGGGGFVNLGGGGGIGGVQQVRTLARTGGDAQRIITLAFLALVLGGLFVLGSRGLAGDPIPAQAKVRRRKDGLL